MPAEARPHPPEIASVRRHRGERVVRWISGIGLAALIAALALAVVWRPTPQDGVVDLVARQPSAGGWSLPRIVVNQGERVRLRIRAEDVVHGFAIGRMSVDAGLIEPGKLVTVEFVADRPGEFTFYCTTWCDPNHPRMRGVLEVRGQAVTETARPNPASDILLQHLDDPRDAVVVPAVVPSATRGLPLYDQRCASCHGKRGEGTARGTAIGKGDALRDRSPVDVFRMMAQTKEQQGLHRGSAHSGGASEASGAHGSHGQFAQDWSEQERWDVVAYLWRLGTTPEKIDQGQRLFVRNCAACHGERGAGDGPGGRYQPKQPANFTNPRTMLAGTSRLYTAKIRRGGMGTGMPYWGSIFTEEELAALVSYLWTFSLHIDEPAMRPLRQDAANAN
jgi:mono/diheme cytochrome c family protein